MKTFIDIFYGIEYAQMFPMAKKAGFDGFFSGECYANDKNALKEIKKGYGGIVLDKTIKLAEEKGYTKFRLYTDEYATSAHKLYKSRGLVEESYDNENDKDEYFDAKIYIYSKSLTEEKIDLWNNKTLGLKEQGKKEHLYD